MTIIFKTNDVSNVYIIKYTYFIYCFIDDGLEFNFDLIRDLVVVGK